MAKENTESKSFMSQNWRKIVYPLMLLFGAAIAFTPFALGGFTLSGAAAIIAKFVELPVANVVFGWLLSHAGTWWGLGIVASLPLALTTVIDTFQAIISAIVHPDPALSEYNKNVYEGLENEADDNLNVRLIKKEPEIAPEESNDTTVEVSNDRTEEEALQQFDEVPDSPQPTI